MKCHLSHFLGKSVTAFFLITAGAAAMTQVYAQGFPTHTVKLVVPYSPGGTADTLGRMVAAGMQEDLGQSIVVENKTGGGSTIGAAAVARAAPDGYTLLLGSGSTHTVAPVVNKNMQYDPVKDFEPISLIGTTSYVLVVNPDKLPVKSLQELIEYGKAHPEKAEYGSTGQGAAVHLTMEMFQTQSGAKFLHVPYRGGAPAMADVLAGEIAITLTTAEQAALIKSGTLRALAVLGPDRLAPLPDVPTCEEAGVPDCTFPVWNAVFAPAGTPEPVIARLAGSVEKALAAPEVKQRLIDLGYTPGTGGAEGLRKRVVEETAFVRSTAEAAGVGAN
ncbi:hypothetical protein CR159_11370 [Pollutimonas subterranea]|uniref:Tripartite-type tricarboxylate transporter receptor subunit TctC n=1 Tax=Pollutimonas subterranea TaxID=2045210 RepID=A0A2N4U4D8_9BURK|nr:tripartite tricarboxylate transporter substrate binding protein [Pollutimonas subterranea]PLC49876.1 hypothetical protein CR159_11370 [Pollutimonas subterranea]